MVGVKVEVLELLNSSTTVCGRSVQDRLCRFTEAYGKGREAAPAEISQRKPVQESGRAGHRSGLGGGGRRATIESRII